ncbi:MAG: hypothetical protein QHJ81_11405 [Anaerolineae bacterium]|nr:hypothetical protein [Anaerolineae bacterium]
MKGYELSFCREYGYPRLVERYLTEVLELIDKAGVLSVILLGSTARGELSYRCDDDRLDLLSDLEMVVVTEGRPAAAEAFYHRLEAWQRERRALNPLFHVDVSFMPRRRFRRLTPLVRWFEMRSTGRVLYGADILDEVPQVTPENLNRGQTRELVLTRLWNLLLYIPAAIVFNSWSENVTLSAAKGLPLSAAKGLPLSAAKGLPLMQPGDSSLPSVAQNDIFMLQGGPLGYDDCGEYERLIFTYVQCRNFLDVATILLPLEGVLLPGYRQRLGYVEHCFAGRSWAEYFGDCFPALLGEALIGKLDLRYSRPALDWYRHTVEAYLGLTAYLLGNPALRQDSHALCEQVRGEGLGFLEGRAHKWLAHELGVALRHAGQKTAAQWMRWLALRKREAMVCFLFNMHFALLDLLSGVSAAQHLDRAAAELAEFALHSVAQASGLRGPSGALPYSPQEQWLALRAAFVREMGPILRFDRRHQAYLNDVIRWEYGP